MLNPTSAVSSPDDVPPLTSAARWTGLISVTTLFFMWGFLTVLNDILVPHLRSVFDLSYFQVSLIQFVFFGAYFLMSIPAGKVVAVLGYKGSMVAGLLTAAAGTLCFYPAASFLSYGFFLGALFILSTGITILQVAANPYISALGRPATASSRLNMAQAFNSLGTTLAPYFGGWLILGVPVAGVVTSKLAEAATVKVPYLELTGVLIFLALILALIKLPALHNVEEAGANPGTWMETLQIPHVIFGAIGIFVYVGAEVSIGSYLVNFMMDPLVGNLPKNVAASYLSYYWGGAMVGRFIGSGLLQVVRANRLLAVNAAIASILCGVGYLTNGNLAMWSVLAIGLFNSIMFPNIFTLGIAELGHLTRRGSSILIMAIVGGAFIPVVMGKLADIQGVHHSLFVPLICYLYIIFYGWRGYQVKTIPADA
jgi:FHS family L-fucose permease-like MFS transporter